MPSLRGVAVAIAARVAADASVTSPGPFEESVGERDSGRNNDGPDPPGRQAQRRPLHSRDSRIRSTGERVDEAEVIADWAERTDRCGDH